MIIVQKHFQLFAIAVPLAAAPLAGAWAQPVDEAIERFGVLVRATGVAIEWDRVDTSGANATLVGVRAGNAERLEPIGDVSLTGISDDDAGYRVERVFIDSYSVGEPQQRFEIRGMELAGVVLPDDDRLDDYGGFLFYDRSSIDEISFSTGGNVAMLITDMHTTLTPPRNGAAMAFAGGAESFMLESSVLPDEQRRALQAMGYDQLTGKIETEGSWDPQDGRLTVARSDLIMDDAGTLGISFEISGYTREFVNALVEMQNQAAAAADADQSAQGLAMLGLMQQLSFHRAEIAFTDNSITERALDFAGAQQGVTGRAVANQTKGVLPFLLGQLNNPELANQATQAVSAFLDNPRNLRVTAAPEQPVPFAMLMAAVMMSPQELTRTMGVRITAND